MLSGSFAELKTDSKSLRLHLFVGTDANGDPTNSLTALDQFGDPLPVPFGLLTVTRTETSLYTLTMSGDAYRIVEADSQVYQPYETLLATVVGSVDINSIASLAATLNGLTLIVTDGVTPFTTTFSSPANAAAVLSQVLAAQTAATNTTSLVQLVTNNKTGAQYLKINSKTVGSTSAMTITGTGRATLGMGPGTLINGVKTIAMVLAGWNSRGNDITLASGYVRTGKTVQFLALDSAFTPAPPKNGGFFVNLALRYHQ